MKRIILTIALTALFMLAIGGINSYIQNRPYTPDGFQDSRAAVTQAAIDMNNLITTSLKTLSEVDGLDRRFAYAQALELVRGELEKTNERNDAAINLSRYLEEMAGYVNEIKPQQNRGYAFEAVSAQIASVTRLTAYNKSLGELFETLSLKFQGKPTNPARVIQLIEELNDHAREINSLNTVFRDLLDEFDSHQ